MNNQEVLKYIEGLKGISYSDWAKLKTVIDRNFEIQVSELKSKIQLTNPEMIEKLIQSQFG